MVKSKTTTKKTSKYEVKITKKRSLFSFRRSSPVEQMMCIDSEGQCHGWKEGKSIRYRKTMPFAVAASPIISPFATEHTTKFN